MVEGFKATLMLPDQQRFIGALAIAWHLDVHRAFVGERACNQIQNEFYASAFRRKLYRSIAEIQADVDVWMESYNAQRTHSGKYCYGKTPMQTFIESAKLAYHRQLDRMQPTSESLEETI